MIKFLDLNTGYSFDGLWTEDQSKGYIFWFPDEQSVNIMHTNTICMLTDNNEPLTLRISDNDVFDFVEHISVKTDIDGYIFDTPKISKIFNTKPEKISDKYYAHVFNIVGKSEIPGEFICKISIGDEGYIRVGADFYEENEATYINLSNLGVEIPDTVQKAIYDANVHEDVKNNILINRKFKELLSNYWDIVANKGSYKSLINSLKWFEWNDALTIKEIWKRSDVDNVIRFDDREIMSIFEDKLLDSFNNFTKTTYISLYYLLSEDTDDYDTELNPVLKSTIMKWSKNDMQLKLSLLAQFFGTFFLPIHMSVFHATLEDKIYTNTIKSLVGADLKRTDCVGDFTAVKCNINENSKFKIGNVKIQVSKSTKFGNKNVTFGVDVFPSMDIVEDHEKFNNQYYAGPGVIIPIKLQIPNQINGDYITQVIASYSDIDETLHFYDRIYANNGIFNVDFNFLAKDAKDYTINMTFITASSKTINTAIKFTVEDIDNVILNIYKVKSKDNSREFTYEDFKDLSAFNYFSSRQKSVDAITPNICTQYLPYMDPKNPLYKDYTGIKLNRTVILEILENADKSKLDTMRGMMKKNFLEFAKYNGENIKYLIYISKKFFAKTSNHIFNTRYKDTVKIIRNDLGFYPQFHTLELMSGNNIDNYTISQYDAVCVAVELDTKTGIKEFRYGKDIVNSEWIFVNSSNDNKIEYPISSRIPFVANTNKSALSSGYYDIIFRYSLKNGKTNEYKLDSAFRIKNI